MVIIRSRPATTTEPLTTTAPASPEPLEDQTPPEALNGIAVADDTIWLAALNSDQVVQVDRATGAILTRVEVGG